MLRYFYKLYDRFSKIFSFGGKYNFLAALLKYNDLFLFMKKSFRVTRIEITYSTNV